MARYVAWIAETAAPEKRSPVFVAYPAGFDFLFVYWYLIRFVGKSPFSHSALDVKTYSMAMLKCGYREAGKRNMPKRWFDPHPHTHVALDDAIEQGALFCKHAGGEPTMTTVAPYNEFTPLAVEAAQKVFVLTGAGISAESGIRTFRDANGLWTTARLRLPGARSTPGRVSRGGRRVAGGWRKDAELVWRFYAERRAQAKTCAPNAAHAALAALEGKHDGLFLCTQNVDPLHERAGSRRAVHMHGELFKSRCESPRCDSLPFVDAGEYRTAEQIPRCRCGARIRPHIVWFGEVPFDMDLITDALEACDLFVTIGSSGAVYPAAGFARAARAAGARTVYVGPEAPENARAFDECRLGKAGEVLPALFVR